MPINVRDDTKDVMTRSPCSAFNAYLLKIMHSQILVSLTDGYLKQRPPLRDSFMKFLIKPSARGEYRGSCC